MIDIKQLRVGAHINYKGGRVKISTIGFAQFTYDNQREVGLIADIDPIPITAELLQELGFESYHYCWVKKPNGNPIKVEDNEDGTWGVSVIGANITVRYLHELEAFVYLTTKQELIKEN